MNTKQIFESMHLQAKALGACDKYTGVENIAELARLFKSREGMEFCLRNKFPSTATMRELKGLGLQQYGIYVDAGEVVIDEPECVVLIGKTQATINVSTHGRHRIYAMRGANVSINAREWAVVIVRNDPSCHLMKNQFDNSIII